MAVVINDFEVIMDQPQPSENSNAPAPAPQQPTLRPEDVARILRHYEQRKARLLAD